MILKKRVSLILMSVLMVFSFAVSSVSAAKVNVTVQVDGKTVKFPDEKPYFENNRVLIPIRFVSEALGAKVDYKKETTGSRVERVVYVELNGKMIRMPVNSDTVLVGDTIVKLDVPARLQGSRVFVPLRFVSEALGATVNWNQSNKLVSISTGKEVTDPDPVPSDDNMYSTDFKWKAGYTELAKELFIDNMKVENGKLTFTLPQGAQGYAGTTKFVPGKTYSFDIGKGKGYIMLTKIYPGRDEKEGYMISLDSSGNEDLEALFSNVNDAIVVNTGDGSAAPLTEVQKLAQKLE
ncbi:copper amine oxidase N-terminal domain-containing protein [Paenibacillus sp. MB22_1]|uniref:copper amine oxidase N-terminal domain-containing protein n=1 Tax=Paenibacillus sp. MB22_1 TaxID=3383121 RepID=UPI0039A25ACC